MASIFGTSANLETALTAGAPGPFGGIALTGSGTVTVNAGAGPAGNNTITFVGSSGGNTSAATFPMGVGSPNGATLGFALNYSAAPAGNATILSWNGTSGSAILQMTSTGALQFRDTAGTSTTGSTPLTSGARHYVEVQISGFVVSSPTAGVTVMVDGAVYLSILNAVVNTAYPCVPHIGVMTVVSGSLTWTTDSIYWLDSSGATSPNTTFLGQSTVVVNNISASPGQFAQYTDGGSATSNWQGVSGIPPTGDTTYIFDATAGDQVAVGASAITALSAVNFVYVRANARQEVSGGGRTLAVGVGNGSTVSYGATQALSTTYACLPQVFDTNPNTAAPWIVSDLAVIQPAVKTVS